MEVSVETMGSLGRRLTVVIPEIQVKEKIHTKMAELSKQVRIKGFRPGKIPATLLQQRFGKSVRAEVVGEVIQNSLKDALIGKDLNPAGMPRIEGIQDIDGKPLEFVAIFEVFPLIELADLSAVEIESKVVEVSDADINDTIEKMATNMGAWEDVERPGKEGDKLRLDLKRESVGDNLEPQSFEDIEFSLNKEQSLPPLVDKLLGKSAGFDETIEMVYPEQWHDEKLRNLKAVFHIKINKVQEKRALTIPELAEKLDLAKDDEQGLREKIKERLINEANKVLQEEQKEKVLEVLLEKNPVEKPLALLENEKNALLEEIERKHKSDEPHEHLSEEELQDIAEKRVVLGLLVNEVIKKHDIKVNNQRVRETIAEQAMHFPDPKRFISYYYSNKDLLQGIERLVLLDQAVEAIVGTMNKVEKAVSYKEVMTPPVEE